MVMKKACVITATRAEYGLLKPLIDAFSNADDYQLQLVVTGTHLSNEFGMTWKTIEADGHTIDAKVDMLLSNDTSTAVSKSLGLMCIGLADTMENLSPDFIVILGDRYEMVGVATVANLFNVPVVHLHGGEITEGALDDSFRHAITKLSHVHFTSTDDYRDRVIQLGENPKNVFSVGAIGIDNIKNIELMSLDELSKSLSVDLYKPFFLVTYHPITVNPDDVISEIDALIEALLNIEETQAVITLSNADVGGRAINERLVYWQQQYPERLHIFASLGQLRYLSAMKYCLAVVGNSSSGILEAPSMCKPTVNIGDRQRGRTQADSIINTMTSKESILKGIKQSIHEGFVDSVKNVVNPYGSGNTTLKILTHLEVIDWKNQLKKSFNDL